jgi:hypothetical protein
MQGVTHKERAMVDRRWELMQKHQESGVYTIFPSHDSARDAAELQRVAQQLRCRLPEEVVAHATNNFGGLYVEVNEDLWPRPQVGDVALVPQHKTFFETLDFELGELAHRKQRKTGFDQT